MDNDGDLDALSAAIRGQAERVTRERIRAMRPGRYTNRIQIEGIDARWRRGTVEVCLVTDADNPRIASRLLRGRFRL